MKYVILIYNGLDWNVTTWQGMRFWHELDEAKRAIQEARIAFPELSFRLYQWCGNV